MRGLRQGWLFWSVRAVLRRLGFAYFRLTVDGVRHIPSRGPAILAGNHPNVLDGILLLIASPRPVRFLVAEEMFFHPCLHWLFEAFGCIPVYRTQTRNGDALRAAIAALEQGAVLGIFPEGTTYEGGQMRTLRRGVGLLALRTGAPVVPLGIVGSDEAYPSGTRLPNPGRIALVFAPAHVFSRTSVDVIPADHLGGVLEETRGAILGGLREARMASRCEPPPHVWKRLQVALAALIVLPLAGLLHATANPSLDPADPARVT